jgi:hypothetical protein
LGARKEMISDLPTEIFLIVRDSLYGTSLLKTIFQLPISRNLKRRMRKVLDVGGIFYPLKEMKHGV